MLREVAVAPAALMYGLCAALVEELEAELEVEPEGELGAVALEELNGDGVEVNVYP